MARGIGIRAEDLQHFTTEEKVAAARRAGIRLVKPQFFPPETVDTRPVPRTEYSSNCWPCRNCGAGVDLRIDSCLLCGYTREKCEECKGTGTIDVGAPAWIGEMPCGCTDPSLPIQEVGYYYPPVEVVPPEEVNDCAGCGDRPAPKDDDGNFMYPDYQRQGEPPVGMCGYCAREAGVQV